MIEIKNFLTHKNDKSLDVVKAEHIGSVIKKLNMAGDKLLIMVSETDGKNATMNVIHTANSTFSLMAIDLIIDAAQKIKQDILDKLNEV